ncbi:MAG: hypothetical protein ACPGVU_22285 [Limisphaerales bacterium]
MFLVNVVLAIVLAFALPLLRNCWREEFGDDWLPLLVSLAFLATEYWPSVFAFASACGTVLALCRLVSDERLDIACKSIAMGTLLFLCGFLLEATQNFLPAHRLGA